MTAPTGVRRADVRPAGGHPAGGRRGCWQRRDALLGYLFVAPQCSARSSWSSCRWGAVAWYSLLIDTHWPLIIIPIFGARSVLATFIMRQFFAAIPDELEEAGRIDGPGRWGIFTRVALPLAGPALASVAIITFLKSWNMYLEPVVFLSSREMFTLPRALTQYVDAYGGPTCNIQLAATLTAVPVLIVFVLAQRHFIQGLAQSGLKG